MIPALLIIFMPRPSIEGSQFFLFPLIGLVSLCLVMTFGRLGHNIPSRHLFLPVILTLLFLIFTQFCTLLLRSDQIRPTGIIEPMRPLLLAGLFVAGAYMGRFHEGPMVKALFAIGVLILVGQSFVCVLQVLNIKALDFIYNTDKLADHTRRILGTLGNPNALAWFSAQAGILCLVTGKSKFRWALIFLAGILIFLSASRSMLILYPTMLVGSVFFLSGKKLSFRAGIFLSVVGVLLLAGLLSIVYLLRSQLGYLSEILKVTQSGSLSDVGSFAGRLELWGETWRYFESSTLESKWVMGLGALARLKTLDNDYLYVFYRYGLLGLLAQAMAIVAVLRVFLKTKNLSLRVFGVQYILVALIIGIQSDMLGGWLPSLFPFYFAGIALSQSGSRGVDYENSNC